MKKNKKTVRPRRVKAVATATTSGIYSPGDAIWSLPRTAAAYDAMLKQVEAALPLPWVIRRECAKLALRAIGITRPKE